MQFKCISVLGGWQTAVTFDGIDYPIGPVFNKSTDLWAWQKINLVQS